MAEVHRLDVEMSEKAKTNLVSSISHELRSPLHGILGTSEILRDTEMNALQHGVGKQERYPQTEKPLKTTQKYGPITSLSLKPSRRARHSGMISLKADIQLDAFWKRLWKVQSGPYGTRTVVRSSIILDIDEAAEWRFSTQIGAWRRIMMNIFGNALKYTKSGFILVKLTASPVTPAKDAVPGESSQFNVTLTVGHGYRNEHGKTTSPGNGLGLSIVYHAVLSMGGHIEVTSLRGRGTEVSIEVPLPMCRL
ncbi:CheY-like superfamily [Penicillium cf. griseofulvum]|nr:CheY-like superfamily [Penicillium cf. griseofulvum]